LGDEAHFRMAEHPHTSSSIRGELDGNTSPSFRGELDGIFGSPALELLLAQLVAQN
jgi:hypothetical protein